ncbi:MAG: GH36-type glycosyl hydrolase domain-containing protein, partial [Acidobacteriota bacterium]
NTAGGYCFYQDAKLRRLTRYRYNNIPMDSNGRYLYIRDGAALWNPMWKPMRVELDRYECRHGLGYTKITARKNDLELSVLFFIPLQARNELWHVRAVNHAAEKKMIRMWSFVEWCLWDALDDMTNFQRNYSTGEVEIGRGAVFHTTEYRERRNHYAYFAATAPVSGYDTSRDAFVGVHQGLDAPQAVTEGCCRNSRASGWVPIGVHQIDLELAPGEARELTFMLGYAENPPDMRYFTDGSIRKDEYERVRAKFSDPSCVRGAFEALTQYWNELLSAFHVSTPDRLVNRMANCWNPYQCMVTFNLSRSASMYESGIGRGMGFRDSNQDVLGFVHMIPSRARARIIDIASTQLSDGTCCHQYQPLTKKGNAELGSGFNDDPLWLVLSVCAYIRETGDRGILDEKAGFADLPQSDATLMDHVRVSLEYTLSHLGPHGLPLIGHADWNDCLNLNCFSTTPGESFQLAGHRADGTVAESVMIAGLFCRAASDLARLCADLGRPVQASMYRLQAENMRRTIMEHGWDGAWFLRAYDAFGTKVGSAENNEGKIFIESQGWCVMGGAGLEDGCAERALESVYERLATPDGIILQQPAYSHYYANLGEVSSYPPGYKENAGIFTHNNTWIQIAETMLGHGDRAMEYYKSICPPSKEHRIDVYRSEPYVYSQMTAGRDAPVPGEGKNSWLTGTAAWSFVALTQHILGIRPDYRGLVVDPCIPGEWKEFTVRRKFRTSTYVITVKNSGGRNRGVRQVRVDGRMTDGNLIPDFHDGLEHTIEAELEG